MKLKLLKLAGLLIAGLLVSANVSAYYVDGGVVRDSSGVDSGSYIGYLGNVNVGLSSIGVTGVLPDDITTYYLSDGSGGYVENNPAFSGKTTHWYSFSSSLSGSLVAYYELGSGVTEFEAIFYAAGGSDSPIHKRTATSAELAIGSFEDVFSTSYTGDLLVEIVGVGAGQNPDYDASFDGAPVPLPPAALLFISALAGFGVIGRRKAGKA